MVEWNPVIGLNEIAYENLRVGDEVVQVSYGEHYKRATIEDPKNHGCNNKYYLLSRKVDEPEGIGDIAELYRVHPRGEEADEIQVYTRVRNKLSDHEYGESRPWTDLDNDAAYDWNQIVSFSTDKPGLAIRTYTATHKENK